MKRPGPGNALGQGKPGATLSNGPRPLQLRGLETSGGGAAPESRDSRDGTAKIGASSARAFAEAGLDGHRQAVARGSRRTEACVGAGREDPAIHASWPPRGPAAWSRCGPGWRARPEGPVRPRWRLALESVAHPKQRLAFDAMLVVGPEARGACFREAGWGPRSRLCRERPVSRAEPPHRPER